MRRPKPWFWQIRNAWYVTIDGKQVRLGDDKESAHREFYRLMASRGELSTREMSTATVPDVIEAFLSAKSKLRPSTLRSYEFHLRPVAVALKGRRFATIRQHDFVRAIDRQSQWNETTKHICFNVVGNCCRWARDNGYIERVVMPPRDNPWVVGRREKGMTIKEFDTLINAVHDDEFKLLLRVLRDTGARPGEIYKMAACHLDPRLPIARLAPHEHKTGRRSGRDRIVVIPEDLMVVMRKLAEKYPTGPLLRNTQGNPWTENNVNMRMRRWKRVLGLPEHCIPYAGRHGFVTRLLDAGVPPALVAKIAGHANTNTTQTHYYHPDILAMAALVNTASVGLNGVKAEDA